MDEYQRPWPVLLPFVQFQVNIKHKNSTNSSPFALVFSRTANDWVPYTHCSPRPITDLDHQHWLERQKVLIDHIYPSISDRISISKQSSNSKFKSSQTSLKLFKEGSLVMVEDVLRSSKSQPRYLGAYSIVRVNPNGSYTLRAFDGSFFPRDVTHDRLKAITADNLKPIDDELNRTFYVTDILDHRTASNGNLEFLVTWQNGDDDSWISVDLIDNPAALRDYFIRRRSPIPDAMPALANELIGSLVAPQHKKRTSRRSSNKRRTTVVSIPAVSPAIAPPAASESVVNGKRQRYLSTKLRDSLMV